MKRLVIVSSFDEQCGVAFYSSRLRLHLSAAGYEVTVKALPVTLLQLEGSLTVKLKADGAINQLARELRDYDVTLLQFEPGLYGSTARSAYRRIRRLLSQARRAVVTVHGLDRLTPLRWRERLAPLPGLSQGHERSPLEERARFAARFWRYVAHSRHIRVITTCFADKLTLQRMFDVNDVEDYPITFYGQDEVAEISSGADRELILHRLGLDPRRTYVGIFGFLSWYKGHLTALKALEHLPQDWHVAIVGGEHPRAVEADRDVGVYLRQLLAFTFAGQTDNSKELPLRARHRHNSSVYPFRKAELWEVRRDLFAKSEFKHFFPERDISQRVHFVGQPSDAELIECYAAIDYAVHPYLKTKSGQSGSGIATLAMEFGARALFSNVPVFREMTRYFPGSMAFFGPGNFMELAQALQRYPAFADRLNANRESALRRYSPSGMVELYRRAIGS